MLAHWSAKSHNLAIEDLLRRRVQRKHVSLSARTTRVRWTAGRAQSIYDQRSRPRSTVPKRPCSPSPTVSQTRTSNFRQARRPTKTPASDFGALRSTDASIAAQAHSTSLSCALRAASPSTEYGATTQIGENEEHWMCNVCGPPGKRDCTVLQGDGRRATTRSPRTEPQRALHPCCMRSTMVSPGDGWQADGWVI